MGRMILSFGAWLPALLLALAPITAGRLLRFAGPRRESQMARKTKVGEKVFNAHLGFFCQPYYCGEAEVCKDYRLKLSKHEAEEVARRQREYLTRLRGIDIAIPSSQTEVVDVGSGKFTLRIKQEIFQPEELAGEIIKNGTVEEAIEVTNAVVDDAIRFLRSSLTHKYGFHPTIRNYAFRHGRAYFIDTFPPYHTEPETRRLMVRAAPTVRAKVAMVAFYPVLGIYTNEYYDPVEMISGIVQTAQKLRPEFSAEIKASVVKKVQGLEFAWKDALLERLSSKSTRLKWRISNIFYR